MHSQLCCICRDSIDGYKRNFVFSETTTNLFLPCSALSVCHRHRLSAELHCELQSVIYIQICVLYLYLRSTDNKGMERDMWNSLCIVLSDLLIVAWD